MSSCRPRLLALAALLALGLGACSFDSSRLDALPDLDAGPDDIASDLFPLETGDQEPDDEGDATDARPDLPPDSPCASDQCDVDGVCYDNGEANPDNPCEACSVAVDPTAFTPDDAATCNDGDVCTSDDACFEGTCMGTVDPCDDGDPCTTGVCDPETGECSQSDNTAACSDGDPCTVGDRCGGGACLAGAGTRSCDDGKECTADRCEPGVGCVSEPLTGVGCDDGSVCTVGDVCDAGACVPGGEALDCDDGDLCTVDFCDPVDGCGHDSVADLCDDANACTDDACDPELGCVFPPNSDPCDDANACTEGDACTEGACRGVPVDLDDGNVCTDLSCDPVGGVLVSFNELPCDDANACTVGDACALGGCLPGTDPLPCSDANVCTDDACDPDTGCVFPPNDDDCDDLDACTVGDVCSDGLCGGTPRVCDDGNACTRDECDAETGCEFPLILSFECRPRYVDLFPPRAATLRGTDPTVTVTGRVVSGAGPVESFTINGTEVALGDDGAFSFPLEAVVGGNVLVFEAVDSFGTTVERVQSFLWSPTYFRPTDPEARDGMVTPGFGLFLGQEVLDDGDRTDGLDDFATIFELVLSDFGFGDFIDPTTPLTSFLLWDAYALGLTLGEPAIALDANAGQLDLSISFAGLRVPVGIVFIWQDPPTSANGFILADQIDVSVPITFSVVDHQLVVDPIARADVVVSITNLRFVSSGGFGNDLLAAILNAFSGTLDTELRTALQDAVSGQLAPILGAAFSALAFDLPVPLPPLVDGGDPIEVRLITDFQRVGVSDAGLTFEERAGAYAESVIAYANLGSLGRSGCSGSGTQTLVIPGLGPFEITLADDTLNEILFAAWRGGYLEFAVPPELLGGIDLSQLGITDLGLTASGLLQPTAFDCSPDGVLLLHLGDLYILADMLVAGAPLQVDIYASLQAELELSAAPDGIGLGITGLRTVDVEVAVADEAALGLEPVIEAQIAEALGPGLLDLLGGSELGSFPLPAIPLGNVVDGVPADTVIAISPETVERLLGNTVVSGSLLSETSP